jgi:hypothetical protein
LIVSRNNIVVIIRGSLSNCRCRITQVFYELRNFIHHFSAAPGGRTLPGAKEIYDPVARQGRNGHLPLTAETNLESLGGIVAK